MSPETLTKERTEIQLPLQGDTIVEFGSVQEAADFLRDRARSSGLDEATIADIETIGTCDAQSRTRIERYCAEMGLQSKYLGWPGKS